MGKYNTFVWGHHPNDPACREKIVNYLKKDTYLKKENICFAQNERYIAFLQKLESWVEYKYRRPLASLANRVADLGEYLSIIELLAREGKESAIKEEIRTNIGKLMVYKKKLDELSQEVVFQSVSLQDQPYKKWYSLSAKLET